MMFCQLYQELRGIQKENKSLCHASIWGIPHMLSSLLGHTHRTDAYYRVSGMACINFAKLSVFPDSIEAQNTFGLSTRANVPLTSVLCHPIWLQRMKTSSPEKPSAKEPHVSQLGWRVPPGVILEGREPCKEEGATVKQMVVSDEVTEEHCTWKMGRSKAARPGGEMQCVSQFRVWQDPEGSFHVAIGNKRLEDGPRAAAYNFAAVMLSL